VVRPQVDDVATEGRGSVQWSRFGAVVRPQVDDVATEGRGP